MVQNKKKKTGLQKDVSSIFKGVVIQQNDINDDVRQHKELPFLKHSDNKYDKPPIPKHQDNPHGKKFVLEDRFTGPEELPLSKRSVKKHNKPPVSKRTGNAPDKQSVLKDSINKPFELPLLKSPIKKYDEQPTPENTDNAHGRPSVLKNLINIPDEPSAPKNLVNAPARPMVSSDTQKPQPPLIKKLNQPTPSSNKESPAKQFVAEVTKEISTSNSPWQQVKNKIFSSKPGGRTARQKAAVALIPVLTLVFIFMLRQVFWSSPSKMEGAISIDTKNTAAVTTNTDHKIDWKIPEPYPITLRDPMKLGATSSNQVKADKPEKENTNTQIIIKGILFSKDNPSALIENQIVHCGDTIYGATVIKIDRDGVEFEMDGKRWKENIRK